MPTTVTHFVGNLDPSLEDVIAYEDGAPVNLTGKTVKLKARAEGASSTFIDRAATVVTPASGIVRFDWQSGDVGTAGEFNAWWEVTTTATGKTQDTPEFVLAFMEHAALKRSLCELEDVTAYAPGYRSDPTTDALLERLIVSVSYDAQRRTAREFKAVTPADSVRRFTIWPADASSRTVRIGDAASISNVDLIDRDQATTLQSAIAPPNYSTYPENLAEWEPIRALFFPPWTALAPAIQPGRVLELTAVWGFPQIPEDLRQAIAARVVFSYMTDAATAGTRFAEALAEVNVGSLFAMSERVIRGYEEPLVA